MNLVLMVYDSWMEIAKSRESSGKWFGLTYKAPEFVSLLCFLGSETDTAMWFHRLRRCQSAA